MINKTSIEILINELEKLYNLPGNPGHYKVYYSKLATMELCGWLEQTMDEIIKLYSSAKIKETKNKNTINDEIIDKTYGFHYETHFRQMLIKVIGFKNIEELEKNLKGDLSTLTSQLGSLWTIRKTAAHTHIAGTTISYHAPSSLKTYLKSLYKILSTLETELLKL